VAVIGEDVLVGAPSDDTGAADAGIVYLFDGSTGQLLRTIRNPQPAAGDHFGWSIAVVGENILVGAYADDGGVGAAHLFDGATGRLLRTFRNPTPHEGDLFGRTVAGLVDKVIVGACADDDNAGAVYVFDPMAEAPLKLDNPRPNPGDRFGLALATLDRNILVGAYGEDAIGDNAGAVYLFDGDSGRLLRTFENPEPESSGEMGITIAVLGKNILIGAGRYEKQRRDVGIAYLLEGSTGRLLRTFRNPTPESGDFFGIPVAAAGQNVLISAPGDHANGNKGGAVYVIEAATGKLLLTIENPTPEAEDHFGVPVTAAGQNVLVGAPSDDESAKDAGTVYLFENEPDSK
jgi:outer membrane protein assembly factor BamB